MGILDILGKMMGGNAQSEVANGMVLERINRPSISYLREPPPVIVMLSTAI
jgi:hypothetical protein